MYLSIAGAVIVAKKRQNWSLQRDVRDIPDRKIEVNAVDGNRLPADVDDDALLRDFAVAQVDLF